MIHGRSNLSLTGNLSGSNISWRINVYNEQGRLVIFDSHAQGSPPFILCLCTTWGLKLEMQTGSCTTARTVIGNNFNTRKVAVISIAAYCAEALGGTHECIFKVK